MITSWPPTANRQKPCRQHPAREPSRQRIAWRQVQLTRSILHANLDGRPLWSEGTSDQQRTPHSHKSHSHLITAPKYLGGFSGNWPRYSISNRARPSSGEPTGGEYLPCHNSCCAESYNYSYTYNRGQAPSCLHQYLPHSPLVITSPLTEVPCLKSPIQQAAY